MAKLKDGGYELDHIYFLDFKDGEILTVNDIRDDFPWETEFEEDAEMVCDMLNRISNDTVFKVLQVPHHPNNAEIEFNIIVDYKY